MILDIKLSYKKKVIMLIIVLLMSIIVSWVVQSHYEYIGASQALPFFDYVKRISVNKVVDTIISLTPALIMIVYAFIKIRRKNPLQQAHQSR